MKKLLYILLIGVPTLLFSQTKKTFKSGDVDEKVNFRLDSLSKKYKKDVLSYIVKTSNGKTIRQIAYIKKNELIYEELVN
jgi:hypothetical protein